jgi:hypothetical protein
MRSRAALQLEILGLRHQLGVLQRSRRWRVRLTQADRLLWVCLSQIWTEWRSAIVIVRPETVIAWHRGAVRRLWMWKSCHRIGRPAVTDTRVLIRTMAQANPLWGAPRIHGELLKLGIPYRHRLAQQRRSGAMVDGADAAVVPPYHPAPFKVAHPRCAPRQVVVRRSGGSRTMENDLYFDFIVFEVVIDGRVYVQ